MDFRKLKNSGGREGERKIPRLTTFTGIQFRDHRRINSVIYPTHLPVDFLQLASTMEIAGGLICEPLDKDVVSLAVFFIIWRADKALASTEHVPDVKEMHKTVYLRMLSHYSQRVLVKESAID